MEKRGSRVLVQRVDDMASFSQSHSGKHEEKWDHSIACRSSQRCLCDRQRWIDKGPQECGTNIAKVWYRVVSHSVAFVKRGKQTAGYVDSSPSAFIAS